MIVYNCCVYNWDDHCVYNCDDHSLIHSFFQSAVQRYEFSYIHFHLITSTGILRIHKMTSSQLALMIAQLIEHCTGIVEVMHSNPVPENLFSGFLFVTCLSCVYNTAMIIHLFTQHYINFIAHRQRPHVLCI